jgi:uncharacterized protein YndB with AHSA1/START domain
MMGHVSYTKQIKATPEQIWAILADVTRLPDWAYTEGRFPFPVEGRYGGDQTEGPGTVWIGVSEDGQTATQKITVWEPNKKLVYELQEMDNAPLEMAQTNTFELAPGSDHIQLTWIVDWELTGGFSLGSLLLRFTGNGAFEEMMAGSLENLRRLVEETPGQAGSVAPTSEEAGPGLP